METGDAVCGRGTHLGILLEREHDLRRAVPPRRDVFGHEPSLGARGLRGAHGPREAEVAHLEVAVGVEEQIRGLEIAVDNVRRVQRLERAERLIDEVLGVVVGEVLRADDAVHVRLHQLLDHCGARSRGGRQGAGTEEAWDA